MKLLSFNYEERENLRQQLRIWFTRKDQREREKKVETGEYYAYENYVEIWEETADRTWSGWLGSLREVCTLWVNQKWVKSRCKEIKSQREEIGLVKKSREQEVPKKRERENYV